jgi:hypothetical protein
MDPASSDAYSKEVTRKQLQLCGFTLTVGEFVVIYNYSPARKEVRLSLRGPVAKIDWSGLQS